MQERLVALKSLVVTVKANRRGTLLQTGVPPSHGNNSASNHLKLPLSYTRLQLAFRELSKCTCTRLAAGSGQAQPDAGRDVLLWRSELLLLAWPLPGPARKTKNPMAYTIVLYYIAVECSPHFGLIFIPVFGIRFRL